MALDTYPQTEPKSQISGMCSQRMQTDVVNKTKIWFTARNSARVWTASFQQKGCPPLTE